MQDAGTTNSSITLGNTLHQYRQIITTCKDLFLQKVTDYGTSWRVLRPISIVDQIYIKAWRIRQIQELGQQKISDSIESEFVGIINYGLIALIQAAAKDDNNTEWTAQQADNAYTTEVSQVESLMLQKNHDYGEAWREMSQHSLVDLILVKLLRIKQIIANQGVTTVSEGADANFMDIINYAVFALILNSETK